MNMAKIKINRGKNIDFPSQSKMYFEGAALSHTNNTAYGKLNIPYALSILNRKSYQQTTTDGVPLVYRVRATLYAHAHDKAALSNAGSEKTDFAVLADAIGVQSNWTVRNAAVKWHAAREEMFKASGVSKKMRGAYSDCIRYSLTSTGSGDVASDYYLKPIDTNGDVMTGGLWDISAFTHEDDSNFALHLLGDLKNESNTTGASSINMIGSYLQSRINQKEDTNEESTGTPTSLNYLNQVFQLGRGAEVEEARTVIEQTRTEGDNPPYETYTSAADTAHDMSEGVQLGRIHTNGGTVGSVILDIPFGLTDLTAKVTGGVAIGGSGLLEVDLLNIYEMMG